MRATTKLVDLSKFYFFDFITFFSEAVCRESRRDRGRMTFLKTGQGEYEDMDRDKRGSAIRGSTMPAKRYTLTTRSGVLIKEWRKGKYYTFERREREMGGFSATLQDERKELFQLQRCCSIRMKEESLLLVVPIKIKRI
jgi:hypothetical protein